MPNQEATLTVANTILDQLGGSRALHLMIGAKGFLGDQDSLSFSWPMQSRNKAKGVNIKLEANDTYTVRFRKVVKRIAISAGDHDMVYADQLINLFERETGLVIRVPSIRR